MSPGRHVGFPGRGPHPHRPRGDARPLGVETAQHPRPPSRGDATGSEPAPGAGRLDGESAPLPRPLAPRRGGRGAEPRAAAARGRCPGRRHAPAPGQAEDERNGAPSHAPPPAYSPVVPADAPPPPDCIVCYEPCVEVAVGACGHATVCADCTLRARLCFRQLACPLCKTELASVALTQWRAGLAGLAGDAAQASRGLVPLSRQAPDILVDRLAFGGGAAPAPSPFHLSLLHRTSIGCPACGAACPTHSALLQHARRVHAPARLCAMCLQGGRAWPRQLALHGDEAALAAHMAAHHPACDFCRRSYIDDDALWAHMRDTHVSCHVCPAPGPRPAYFRNFAALSQHVHAAHHVCPEPDCARQLTAFATPAELARHAHERHSSHMPRWDPGRARPLTLDVAGIVVGGGQGGRGSDAPGGGDAPTQATGRRRGQPQRGPAAGAPAPPRRFGSGDVRLQHDDAAPFVPGFQREFQGGLQVHDDDAGEPRAAHGRRPAPPAAFPTLSDAAAAEAHGNGRPGAPRAADPSSTAAGGAHPSARRAPPPLVKKTTRCPCGRRTSHYALEESEAPPPLACDGACALAARRATLADAFGVDGDPAAPRAFGPGGSAAGREVRYDAALISAAQRDPAAISRLEAALADFVAGGGPQRRTLWPMPHGQRAVAHALAGRYGLVSVGVGQEPQRCVQLLRTPSAALPLRPLSRVAPGVTPAELAAMEAAEADHPVRFTEVALSADLHYYLRRWEGAYRLDWEGADVAIAQFPAAADQKEVLDAFGGGIRGLFKIDRSWTRYGAAPASAGDAASGGRGWAGAAPRAERAGDDTRGPSWSSMALAQPPPSSGEGGAPAARARQSQEQDGRWAVMKRPVRAAEAPARPQLAQGFGWQLLGVP
ncbi:hypothetical protein ACKKBF_B21135 [Auxenochlorella protothecoides x Auxenochlorella symbiontica]